MTLSNITSTDSLPTIKTRNPLFQQDLFFCVLDCLAAKEADLELFKAARPALFSLARTCRVFSEPSLDRLWYKLHSLDPLVQCYATLGEEGVEVRWFFSVGDIAHFVDRCHHSRLDGP